MNNQSHLRRRTCLGFAMGLAADLAVPHGLGESEGVEEETASGDLHGLRGMHYSIVHPFAPGEGRGSKAGILAARDGRGYGTTSTGNTVYSIDRAKQVQLLHQFTGEPGDGYSPEAPVVEADDGALYGTTLYGGSTGTGVVYRLGHGGMTILHDFGATPEDGLYLSGGIIFASDGQFYGAAERGGMHGNGVIYRMDKSGNVTPLWQLGDQPGDPRWPAAAPREGPDGRLYGTSSRGGLNDSGTIYSVAKDGSDPRVVLSCGGGPEVPVTFGSDGSIYCVTASGGGSGYGSAFRLQPDGSVIVLHAFNCLDGNEPHGELLEWQPGVFIGTTRTGGSPNPYVGGVIYMVRSDGRFRLLHKFGWSVHGQRDFTEPSGALLLGPGGQVTGTCAYRGHFNSGGIWKLVPVPA